MVNGNTILIAGIAVVILGMLLIFVGTALQSGSKTGEVKTGGVILIGPIPIIFGTDKGLVITAVILAIVLMVVAYLLFYRHLFG
jgi:TIGR00304 family protein